MLYQGYRRAAAAVPNVPALPRGDYARLFAPAVPDVSRDDNKELAEAAEVLTRVWRGLVLESEPKSRTLTDVLLTQLFRFMGEPQEASKIRRMTDEIFTHVDRDARIDRRPQTADRGSAREGGKRPVVVNGHGRP